MLDISSHTDSHKRSEQARLARTRLARIRRLARGRGFRILRDWQGTFSLVDTKIEPPRALTELFHVPPTEDRDRNHHAAAAAAPAADEADGAPDGNYRAFPGIPPRRHQLHPARRGAQEEQLMTSANGIIRMTLNMLEARGFTPTVTNGRHLKIRWCDGNRTFTVVVSRSPSDRRAINNARATLRRILRSVPNAPKTASANDKRTLTI
jgi:hypothetical protein